MQMKTMSSSDFCAALSSGKTVTVLDVRTEIEHMGAHVNCAHDHVPLDRLDVGAWMKRKGIRAGDVVHVLCASGKRAGKAAELLEKRGIEAVVVEGGLGACVASGLKTEGKKVISLERQVRIAAGAIAATGALLALTVSASFAIVPLFVGCGLVFAGVTDWCGMAMLLAKAPWNVDPKAAAMKSIEQFELKNKGA